jgi:HK97 family phage major capsid protein
MNKKMREIMAQIQAKTAEAKSFMAEGENKDVAKATALMNEVDTLRTEYETEKRIFEAEKAEGVEGAEPHAGNGEPEVKELTGEQIVAKEVRSIMTHVADKDLVESVDADGGYTVPEDIVTKVNHYPEIVYSFLDDISVENVATNKGARTYQKKSQTEAFIDLDENGAITKKIAAPQFERVTYAIQDRAGFMPVSNDLVNDSDANITAIVTEWLGRANIATANEKILGIIKAKTQVAIDGIAGIKKIVNVDLGQAYKSGAKIITNDDGLNYLDTLEDANGRPLLNPDPTDSARLALRCGTVVVPVKVVPNAAFASAGTKVPFVIGDLKAGIRKYNRQAMSLKASDVAVLGDFNAFAMNMTLIRAILRDDYKSLDADAYVYGYIDTAAQGN